MRLFTALDLPSTVRDHLDDLKDDKELGIRWSPPSQFHITLRFIGNADPDRAARYQEALGRIRAPAVECIPYGLDVLPSRRNPRVLVVGLERTDDLVAVYRAVSDALENEGLEPEDRDFRPHVTLGRLKDVPAPDVHEFLEAHGDLSLDSFPANAVHLYESRLTKDGAVHNRLASFALET